MRIRRKPWAQGELLACPYHSGEPWTLRGKWRGTFAQPARPLMLELGCGKGGFIAELALREREVNFIAVDKISNMLGLCRRAVEARFAGEGRAVDNVRLAACDIERIASIFAPEDRIERIYINFCNPWPKERHRKHRLTHTRQLLLYRTFLVPGGELWFKTDDAPLFADTLDYLREAGFNVEYQSNDLHRSGFAGNIETEHERMFAAQGLPIHFLIARAAPSG